MYTVVYAIYSQVPLHRHMEIIKRNIKGTLQIIIIFGTCEKKAISLNFKIVILLWYKQLGYPLDKAVEIKIKHT